MTADEVKVEKKKKKKAETKEEKEQHAAELEKKLEEGVEVNEIDAEVLTLESEEIINACANIDTLINEELTDKDSKTACEEVLKQVRRDQISLNITPDYKYFILMAGIFNPKRTMVNHWEKFAPCFTNLVSADGDDGLKRVFQAIIIFYTQTHTAM